MQIKPLVAGIGLLAVLGVVGGGLFLWKYRQLHAQQGQGGFIPALPVEMVTAETIPWQPRSRLVGTVIAVRSVNLANEIVGVVKEVNFDSGATVEPGQVLLKLDTSTEEADLAAAQATKRLAMSGIDVAEAEITMSKSAADLARTTLKRYKNAVNANSVSASDVDRATSEVERAEAAMERAESSLARARAEKDQAEARVQQIETIIAKKTLKAPFRARAGMRTVHPGQYLAEGTKIVDLTELTDNIYLDFAVPQEYAQRVSAGMVVSAQSKLLASDDAKITVVSVDATVNPVTRNVRVRSSVPNPDFKLKPGMFIDVEVPVAPAVDSIVVPATAVRRAAFGPHVYVIVPAPTPENPQGKKVSHRMVQLGANLGDRVVVASGLKAGEQVAAGGSFKLMDGAAVAIVPAPGQKAASPATAGAEKSDASVTEVSNKR
ncbi:MAG: efflux RND transporter periplasmic adaptor subunit [Phycisphaerae bacterium]|nr:efflux RND transporter periplasmic adaptor subunit [Phycisphaerae bacterium]MBN8597893.1 efflux RND transporter periplasmic adaptor subunit [Planctomycetota bacterium]